jgi:hypothetical protein
VNKKKYLGNTRNCGLRRDESDFTCKQAGEHNFGKLIPRLLAKSCQKEHNLADRRQLAFPWGSAFALPAGLARGFRSNEFLDLQGNLL